MPSKFFFTRTWKERLVTFGVLVVFAVCFLFAFRGCDRGNFWCASLLIIPLLIIKGLRIGYWIGRFLFGFMMIGAATFPFNPFTFMDFYAFGVSMMSMILRCAPIFIISLFGFYSLGEHAKLRASIRPDPAGGTLHN
jgi:hypothetical protein